MFDAEVLIFSSQAVILALAFCRRVGSTGIQADLAASGQIRRRSYVIRDRPPRGSLLERKKNDAASGPAPGGVVSGFFGPSKVSNPLPSGASQRPNRCAEASGRVPRPGGYPGPSCGPWTGFMDAAPSRTKGARLTMVTSRPPGLGFGLIRRVWYDQPMTRHEIVGFVLLAILAALIIFVFYARIGL
jgi:hypothetical protein